MANTTFLTEQFLKESVAISQNVDPSLLSPFYSIAENLHIYPVLGTALTSSLISMVEAGNVSGDSETLLNDYVLPAAAWYCLHEASPFLLYRAENKGITKKFADNSQALDKAEFATWRQAVLDKAMYYRNRLIQFLRDNKSTYPLWREDDCDPQGRLRKDFSSGIYV